MVAALRQLYEENRKPVLVATDGGSQGKCHHTRLASWGAAFGKDDFGGDVQGSDQTAAAAELSGLLRALEAASAAGSTAGCWAAEGLAREITSRPAAQSSGFRIFMVRSRLLGSAAGSEPMRVPQPGDLQQPQQLYDAAQHGRRRSEGLVVEPEATPVPRGFSSLAGRCSLHACTVIDSASWSKAHWPHQCTPCLVTHCGVAVEWMGRGHTRAGRYFEPVRGAVGR